MDPEKLPKRASKNVNEVYTLVLDLDETLIHFEIEDDVGPDEEPGYYLIRPGALKFLLELSDYYEIVVFTAAMPDVSNTDLSYNQLFYSHYIVRRLDPGQYRPTQQDLAQALPLAYHSSRRLRDQRPKEPR